MFGAIGSIGGAIVGGIYGGPAGAGVGAGVGGGLGSVFDEKGDSRKEDRGNYHQDMQQQHIWDTKKAKLGRDMDVGAQQEMFDFRMNRAKEAGLTNVEAFGSPSSGAGGGTGAATSTLGNAGSSTGAQLRQSRMQANVQKSENAKDRSAALMQTAMQTEAQKKTAEISAGATTGAAETSANAAMQNKAVDKAIADGRLKLDRDTYETNKKLVESKTRLSNQEIEKVINDTATSDPKFVTAMKQLSMGPANLLTELTMRHHGIQLSDGSFKNMPVEKRKAILSQLLALSSSVYVEGQGATALGRDASESSLIDSVIDALTSPFTDDTSDMEQTPSLGKKSFNPKSPSTQSYRH